MIKKFISYISILILICFLIGCNNLNLTKDKKIRGNQNNISNNSDGNFEFDYSSFKGFSMPIDNIQFQINGKVLPLNLPIYLDRNRYYIPLNEFIEKLNGQIKILNKYVYIKFDNKVYSIDLNNNIVTSPNNNFTLKKELITQNNIYYIGFSDFSNMLNLYTRWDKNSKIINCKTNGFKIQNHFPYKSKINQIGLIRFEDVGLNSQPYSKDYFEKLRIIANYMYQKNIPYHIAWIPRYTIPNQGIDNDPLTKNNFEIAEMIYSLDYFTTHNGIIGLHGYTHQTGDEESGVGFEFGKFEPSVDIFKEKIEKAIKTASYLDVPISFFEVPHYEITPNQNKIAEKYFKILYYPFNDFGRDKAYLTKPQLSPYNKFSYYISTPLDYIPVGKEDITLDKIKMADTNKMGNVFFHPALENNYISLTEDDDASPTFIYEENSTLKKLINILEEKGYNIISVNEI